MFSCPPHPGPVTAATVFDANVGVVLIAGVIVAIPTWILAVYLYSRFIGPRIELDVPQIFSTDDRDGPVTLPHWASVVGLLLLPMVLIFANTGLSTLDDSGVLGSEVARQWWFQLLTVLGETPIALLITLLTAAFVLVRGRRSGASTIQETLEGALPPVCSVILITGAGGMFGGVLRTSGIGDALTDILEGMGIPLILAGFLIAAILRIAQGSSTVALTTAAGLVSSGVADAGYGEIQLAAMVLTIAAGSVVLSHFNDSGFWLVGRFFQMDEMTTLKTWTVMETLIGVIGFGLAALVFGIGQLLH